MCEWPRVRDDGTRARARVYVRTRDGGERNLSREWQWTDEKVHAWYAGTQVRAPAPGEYHVRVVQSVYTRGMIAKKGEKESRRG